MNHFLTLQTTNCHKHSKLDWNSLKWAITMVGSCLDPDGVSWLALLLHVMSQTKFILLSLSPLSCIATYKLGSLIYHSFQIMSYCTAHHAWFKLISLSAMYHRRQAVIWHLIHSELRSLARLSPVCKGQLAMIWPLDHPILNR